MWTKLDTVQMAK